MISFHFWNLDKFVSNFKSVESCWIVYIIFFKFGPHWSDCFSKEILLFYPLHKCDDSLYVATFSFLLLVIDLRLSTPPKTYLQKFLFYKTCTKGQSFWSNFEITLFLVLFTEHTRSFSFTVHVARANRNKSKKVSTFTTTASKYIPKKPWGRP